jgi:hypothetical protein
MVNRVMVVMAIVSSNMPLSIFDNKMFQNYLQPLNSKHRTPHQMEQNHIIEVLMDCTMKELSSILSDHRAELGGGLCVCIHGFFGQTLTGRNNLVLLL